MPFPLTGTGAGYNSSGVYGASLNAGRAESAAPVITALGSYSIVVQVRGGTAAGSIGVAAAQSGVFWVGKDGAGKLAARYGGSSEVNMDTSSVNLVDGAAHEIEFNFGPAGGKLFVDGVLVNAQGTAFSATSPSYANNFVLRALNSAGSFATNAEVDDVGVFSAILHTATYTPAGAPISSAAANLVALWKLDSNLNDSAGAPTGPTLTSPTIAGVTATSATPGISTDTAAGTLYLVLNPVNAAPTAAQVKAGQDHLSATQPSGNQSISSTGAKTDPTSGLSASTTYYPFWVHSDGSGNDSTVTAGTSFTTSAAAATATTLSGPSSGTVGVASTNFTVGANGAITGTVVVTPSDGGAGGTFAPTSVSINSGSPTGTFTYTAASTGAKTISTTNNGGLTNPSNITFTASASATKAPNDAGIVYSPYNWLTGSGSAKTINAGGYFRTLFTGASCTLNFDMANASTPYSRLLIRVDRRTWQAVPMAATVSVTMPSGGENTKHLLEVVVDATSETINRWNAPQNTGVVLTGITLASSGETLTAPEVKPKKVIAYGDSITEQVRALGAAIGANDVDRNSAAIGWALELGNYLDAEVGVVGFGSQGISDTGNGNVPGMTGSWDLLWASQARTFSPAPDYCIWLQGHNDGAGNTVSAGTTMLNAQLAAMAGTQFILFKPFSGNQAANLQSIRSGCSAPGRVRYIDTAGFFNTADSSDTLHPYGYTCLASIAPKMAAAILAAAATTSRTVTLTLYEEDGTTLAANKTGLNGFFFPVDQPHEVAGVLAEAVFTGETTDASGVMTFTVNTVLASGGRGLVGFSNSDGTTSQASFVGTLIPAQVS